VRVFAHLPAVGASLVALGALLEVGLRGGGASAWLAAFCTGAGFGALLGVIAGLLAQRPAWRTAILILPAPLLHLRELGWAIERAGELSPRLTTLCVWLAALGLASAGAFGAHRFLFLRLARRFWPALLASTTWVILLVLLLDPLQSQHLLLRETIPWLLGVAALVWLIRGTHRIASLSAAAVLAAATFSVVPNPYYELQGAAGGVALGAVMALAAELRERRGRAAQLSARGLAAWVMAAVGMIATGHRVVRRDDDAWKSSPTSRGVFSTLVRLGHRLSDFDHDGHGSLFAEDDCAPFNADAAPGRHEIPGNDLDENCLAGPYRGDPSAWLRRSEAHHPQPPPHHGDIVLVVIDTLRYDDAVAESAWQPLFDESVVFDRAYASAPMTAMSMMTILADVTPDALPLDPRGSGYALRAPLDGLGSDLGAAGYRTAIIGAADSDENPLFLPSTYGHGFAKARLGRMTDSPESVTDRAIETWNEMGSAPGTLPAPRLLYVHHMWVHQPTRTRDEYRLHVHEVARELMRLRAAIGSEALWVITADHGEEFGEHGGSHHASTLYDEVLHVPLAVAWPGVAARRVHAVTPLRSIYPTLLAAARPDIAPEGPGPYLCIASDPCLDQPVPLALQRRGIHLHGLILGARKIVRDLERDTTVAFDLVADPSEQTPLSPIPGDLAEALVHWEERVSGPRDRHLFWPYRRP
jgi:hypothetical protein